MKQGTLVEVQPQPSALELELERLAGPTAGLVVGYGLALARQWWRKRRQRIVDAKVKEIHASITGQNGKEP